MKLNKLTIFFILITMISCRVQINADHLKKGYQYLHQGDVTNAIGEFDYAIFLNPDNSEAYRGLTQCYMSIGNYEKALVNANKSIIKDPNNFYSYNDRAAIYISTDEFEKSLPDLDKVLELDTINPNFALFNKATALNKLNRNEEALTCFNKLIINDPLDSRAIFKRGLVKLELGLKEESCDDFKKSGEMGDQEALDKHIQTCK